MTSIPEMIVSAEPSRRTGVEKLNALLYSLQQARLDLRNNATLDDLLQGRNPYHLRATRNVAFQLVSYCLDNFLLAAEERLFASFTRELSACDTGGGQQPLESSALLERFARDDLPLRADLLDATNRASNRLTHQFLVELCDEDGNIDWEHLTRFISGNEVQNHLRATPNRTT